MANYAYIHKRLPLVGDDALAEKLLRPAVTRALDERWAVTAVDWNDGGPTWFVHLPGTAKHTQAEASAAGLALGDDIGFTVALRPGVVVFRHGPMTPFERWAGGRAGGSRRSYPICSAWASPTTRQGRRGRLARDATGRTTRFASTSVGAFRSRRRRPMRRG